MTKTGIGRNIKKGGNPSYELYELQALNRIWTAVVGGGGIPSPTGLATETTTAAILTALNASTAGQDIEVLLVRDTGNGDKVVQQIVDYTSGTPVIIYKDVNGVVYTPLGTLEYLDPSNVLNLILTQLTPATRSHNTLNVTNSGGVPASLRGSVLNLGNANGMWNGIVIPPGVTIPWGDITNRDVYGGIAYDATGTNFIIEYTL